MAKTRYALLSALLLVGTAPLIAQSGSVAPAARYGAFGIDLSARDPSIKPGDDFFRYANNNWFTRNPIPADRTSWGVDVVQAVNSPRVKLLYDIYHMQIMEGDVIRTIRDNIQHIGHFHTAGNPGRNELDETQELYYPPILKTIAATDYAGYVGQEFVPREGATWAKSLEQAYLVCDV